MLFKGGEGLLDFSDDSPSFLKSNNSISYENMVKFKNIQSIYSTGCIHTYRLYSGIE